MSTRRQRPLPLRCDIGSPSVLFLLHGDGTTVGKVTGQAADTPGGSGWCAPRVLCAEALLDEKREAF